MLSRQEVDRWSVADSGLKARVVHCMTQAGAATIHELRQWKDPDLMALRNFGIGSLKNVHWFFNWTKQLEAGQGQVPDARQLLRKFLIRQEVFVLEQRYGLTDPLFRPQMRRRTLQEIAKMQNGLTRERVRQVEEAALIGLRSKLCRAASVAQEQGWAGKINGRGGAVSSAALADWASDPSLGGYQPWGTLLLFSEVMTHIHFRYDFFTTVDSATLDQVENKILELLRAAREPVPFEQLYAAIATELAGLPDAGRPLLTVLLDHHPGISGTVERRYFLPELGDELVIGNILQARHEPLHFHELTRLYNDRILAHNRRGTGYILRVLSNGPRFERVKRAVYQLKT